MRVLAFWFIRLVICFSAIVAVRVIVIEHNKPLDIKVATSHSAVTAARNSLNEFEIRFFRRLEATSDHGVRTRIAVVSTFVLNNRGVPVNCVPFELGLLLLLLSAIAFLLWRCMQLGARPHVTVSTISLALLLPAALGAVPSVGPVIAVPNVLAVNTPTQVLVTVAIADPSLLPNSVNLLRFDSSGRATILATLHDDGANGDAVAGDKTFSTVVTFTESTVGSFRLQISAAFRGRLTRVMSPIGTMFVQTDLSAEQTLSTIADEVATGNMEAALMNFSPSDANRDTLMSLDANGRQKLASALKNARLVSVTGGLRIYEIPFTEQDGTTSYVELSLSRTGLGPTDWQVVNW